jgi:hypothetical protein
MTREEIEKRMHELARDYVEIHDQKIIDELYELARELEKLEKLEKKWRPASAWPLSLSIVTDLTDDYLLALESQHKS